MLLSSNWMTVFLEGKQKMAWLARLARVVRLQTRRWSERTSQSQLNLIDQLLPRQAKGGGHDWPPPVTSKVGVRETLDDFWSSSSADQRTSEL
ncbi:Os09g0349200 [Oryza sativa Japonica Group]|uniref:Os09g0349200 protein n=1 Tax=Oryza sativa subsp. japonica TaxID=39947 RepID=A0A0P0XKI9_ORYSJ|nr:Os09g0349200 [Oryza sativa Japonica Group]